ncbi:MAG TPA: hypothetical protein VGM51_09570 [Armatimonadota bacterium]
MAKPVTDDAILAPPAAPEAAPADITGPQIVYSDLWPNGVLVIRPVSRLIPPPANKENSNG